MPERVLPWLLVLSALLFAVPFSPLAQDPYPHLAGTGIAVIFLLPAAFILLVTRARLGAGWLFVAVLAWAVCVARPLAPVTDTLEARRALLILALAPLAFAGGATLERVGRAHFALALVLLSCAWTLQALLEGRTSSWAGLLGDSGSLSQAALPGAAVGAAWLVRTGGVQRWLGAVALALFLAHAAAAPVLAGSHALLAGLLLAAWLGRGGGRGAFAALALCALLSPFVGLAAREWTSAGTPSGSGEAAAEPAHSLGGLGVRARVWKAALGLIGDHPFVGAGPGQFQAAFPPYRDAREIELSRHGVCSELDTEVEHAHNDWLQGFLELGIPGGLLFALALLLALRAALRALADEERLALAIAALALLVNACVHAPFLANPASAPLAFALFGALQGGGPATRRAAFVAALPLFIAAPFAPKLITHGTILADYVRSARRLSELAQQPESEARTLALASETARARAVLLAAERSAPDSAPLALLLARVKSSEERSAAWERVLRLRPHAPEAWEQSATDLARRGDYAGAHERYRRALALSPTHPRILENLARLELTQGELEGGLEALERLRIQGCLPADLPAALGIELVLELGLPRRGARVLLGKDLEQLSPEALHAAAREPGLAPASAEAQECLAQLLWGREHAEHGTFEHALRNYRQARERSQGVRGRAAALYELELAAAEVRDNQRTQALERVQGVRVERSTWDELPPWAREALADLGLVAAE